MKKLNDIDQAAFDELLKNIGGSLIVTMRIAEIPNNIDATYDCDGNKYKFRFEKLKTDEQNKELCGSLYSRNTMTKDEILDEMCDAMPWRINDSTKPYIKEAMEIYASQEAKAYVSWRSNQVIAGRTAEKLWADYKTLSSTE